MSKAKASASRGYLSMRFLTVLCGTFAIRAEARASSPWSMPLETDYAGPLNRPQSQSQVSGVRHSPVSSCDRPRPPALGRPQMGGRLALLSRRDACNYPRVTAPSLGPASLHGKATHGAPASGLVARSRSPPFSRRLSRPCPHASPAYCYAATRFFYPDGPNQLWVADITYVAIATGFVYLAAILDAWSRRVVGYAISRSIDARLTIAALDAAVRSRARPAGCVHHSARGSQYAALSYWKLL